MEQSASYQSSSEQTTIGHMYKHKQTDLLRSSAGRSLSSFGGRINDGSLFSSQQSQLCQKYTHRNLWVFFFSLSLRSTSNTTCNLWYRLRNMDSFIKDCVRSEDTHLLQLRNYRSNTTFAGWDALLSIIPRQTLYLLCFAAQGDINNKCTCIKVIKKTIIKLFKCVSW